MHLKLAINRLRLQRNKKQQAIKVQRHEIASLLTLGKEDSARIKVEQIIQEDNVLEAYDVLELYCELLSARMQIIVASVECPPDLVEAVVTLIFASSRVEIPEFAQLRDDFILKWGREYVLLHMNNESSQANTKVVSKLSIAVPDRSLVLGYLRTIASEHSLEVDLSGLEDGLTGDGTSSSVLGGLSMDDIRRGGVDNLDWNAMEAAFQELSGNQGGNPTGVRTKAANVADPVREGNLLHLDNHNTKPNSDTNSDTNPNASSSSSSRKGQPTNRSWTEEFSDLFPQQSPTQNTEGNDNEHDLGHNTTATSTSIVAAKDDGDGDEDGDNADPSQSFPIHGRPAAVPTAIPPRPLSKEEEKAVKAEKAEKEEEVNEGNALDENAEYDQLMARFELLKKDL